MSARAYLLSYRVHATGQEQHQQFSTSLEREMWIIAWGARVEILKRWETERDGPS